MNNVFLSVSLIISAILMGNLVIYGISRRDVPGMLCFSLLLTAMVLHSVGYAFELLSTSVPQMYVCTRIEYFGAAFYPFLTMLFVRESADEKRFANKYMLILMLTISAVTLVLVYTNPFHHLYYRSMGIDTSLGFPILAIQKGDWYFVQMASLYFSMTYSVIVFGKKLKRTSGNYRTKIVLMLAGVSVPMLSVLCYTFGLGPVYLDVTPFSYPFMSLFLIIGLLRYDMLTLTPITYETIFQAIGEAVLVVDADNVLLSFNQAAVKFFPSLSKIKMGTSLQAVAELRDRRLESAEPIQEIHDRLYSFRRIDIDNRHKAVVYVISDITEPERTKKQLEILASEDFLTGLYNRRHFIEKLKHSSQGGTFVILDLDHFKSINDTYGHFEGDRVLHEFGTRIKAAFSGRLACRYGGEEFGLFLAGTDLPEAFDLVEDFRKEIEGLGGEYRITFSAGMVRCETDVISAAMISADQKLYEAKNSGRNQTRY